MKLIYLLSALLLVACGSSENKEEKNALAYPSPEKRDSSSTYFGTKVSDPYRWLEEVHSDETEKWVTEQRAITENYLYQFPQRGKIKKRLTEIWNYEKFYAPFQRASKLFYYENDGIKNQLILYVKDSATAPPRVLLDPNELSDDGTAALVGLAITKDAKIAAYAIAQAGSDWNTIYIKDIETGEVFKEQLDWIKFSSISWYRNGFYYCRYDAPNQGEEYQQKNTFHKVYYHVLGTSQDSDMLIYNDENHAQRTYSTDVTSDEKYLILSLSESTSGGAFMIKDLTKPSSEFISVIDSFSYEFNVIDHIDGRLLVVTDEGAPRNRLIIIDPKNPTKENWQEIIPEQTEVLKSVSLCNGKIVAKYLKDVSSRLYVYSLSGEKLNEIELPGLGMVSSFNSRNNQESAYFQFVNFTMPPSVYKYDSEENSVTVYKRPKIDFDSESLVTEQVFYESKDGSKIPMFITHKKNLLLDGNNPTFLFGYGGFNLSYTPDFRTDRTIFLENGGIYAVANLRGGGEYGEEWHQAGVKMNKQNVFDDFISAAEFLIEKKYTRKEKLAIHGRSNGGLLIGAVMTQRPDLCQVAIPKVGVLDMLRYHQFTIGWAWAGDYGTSTESKEMFDYLKAYSPVHNVKSIEYPATLVVTGDRDDRVVPGHSFKFIAELQEHQQGNEPVLIRIDSKAGHGAGKPVSKQIEEFTDTWTFVFHHLGMKIN